VFRLEKRTTFTFDGEGDVLSPVIIAAAVEEPRALSNTQCEVLHHWQLTLVMIIILLFFNRSGYLGASGCMILASWGSAWGTWKAGMGVCSMGIDHPKGIIKNIVPIVMAGVLGIYGLIVSVIITQAISPPGGDGYNTYSVYNGYTHVSS
jgi:ATP synthase proteolipid subunit